MTDQDRPEHDAEWYIAHLLTDVDRFVAVLETADLTAAVPWCGDWDLTRLAEHQGQIHRWARFCAVNSRPPDREESAALETFDPSSRERIVEWFREGADALVATLRSLDPNAPTWHPFPVERVAAVWPRRQAHETSIHRWDAQRAVGAADPIDPDLASDGIDEYFEIAVPRLVAREQLQLPSGSLHVHCTDVDGEWLVWNDPVEGFQVVRAHQKGDAAVRGPAEAILLRLWGRESALAGQLSPVGDESVLDDWFSIAGM